jgi:uncharacterized pyridoxamine 5'-phosphate oxidase family protein
MTKATAKKSKPTSKKVSVAAENKVEEKIYIVSETTKEISYGNRRVKAGEQVPFDQNLFDLGFIIEKNAKS